MNEELNKLIGDVVVQGESQTPQNPPVSEPGSEEQPGQQEQEPIEQKPGEEPAKQPEQKPQEQTIPLAIYMDLKHEYRDLRKKVDELHAAGLKPAAPAVSEDPIDVYIRDKAEGDPNATIPASVYKAHDKWVAEQNAATTETNKVKALEQSYNYASTITMSPQVLGEGLGIDDVIAIGSKYLTAGDKVDIKNAEPNEMPRLYYRKCFERTLRSGTPDAQILKTRLQAAGLVAGKPNAPQTPNKQNEAPQRHEIIAKTHPNLARLGLISSKP